MGAWGTGTFENDTACDFAADVAESSDLKKIQAALDRVLKAGKAFVEAPDAEEALAAADIVARLNGRSPSPTPYTEKIDNWVKRAKLTPSPDLVGQSRRAVNRILTPPSELLDLWTESSELDSWKSSVNELLHRL